MHLYCHRKLDGRFVVETVSGDRFEFAVLVMKPALRLLGQPHWMRGSAPQDADVRIDLARDAARRLARDSGLSV